MSRYFALLLLLSSPLATRAANLASGEWFIDGDPGHGAGTAFTLPGVPASGTSVTIPLATMNGLTPGFHLLGVRVKDAEGAWGVVVWRGFHKQVPDPPGPGFLAGGEWFFDEDPGAGQGTAFPLPAVVSAAANPLIPAAALNALPEGFHLLGVRTQDSLSRWGTVVWRGFHIDRTPPDPSFLASVEYRLLRDGVAVDTATLTPAPVGLQAEWTVDYGKDGLELDADYLLEVTPTDALGQPGHTVYAPFSYKTYPAAWTGTHFTAEELQDPSLSGDDADPDGDGLTNAAERLFALNPRDAADSARAAATLTGSGPGGPVTVGFRVPAGGSMGPDGIYRTGTLRYTLRETGTLNDWSPTPAARISHWSLTSEEQGAARLRFTLAPGTAPRLFYQLEGTP